MTLLEDKDDLEIWNILINNCITVLQVAIQKFKDQDIQNYNFSCCFVWVWNLVVDIAGGKEAEGVWENGVDENIWT